MASGSEPTPSEQTRVTGGAAEPPGTAASPAGGRLLGAWRLLRPLGEGGMGQVFLAERADQAFQRQAAVKIIRPGFESAVVHERFLLERQTLAALAHPHIARLLDAGNTDDGRPYFVMEYVEGVPIDEWCRERSAGLEQRLALFLQVCEAVQYAHGRLIVHRDIKPTNILVDGDGQVRLLDFGIAKLLPSEGVEAPGLTSASERLLTPQYAAPEQVLGGAVGTAADVYALGMLLYLLLAGELPYRLAGAGPAEMQRLVCEAVPPPPSQRPADRSQSRRLRGDLDHIAMMALRKEPERRYQTVEQLAADLRRHIDGLPVLAQPDTLAYRSRKFVARHRLAITAAVMVLLALVGGITASVWQMRQAQQARALAEQRYLDVRKLAADMLFEVDAKVAPLPGSTAARQLLVQRVREQLGRLAESSSGDASLQRDLAQGYEKSADILGNPYESNLGDVTAALADARRALALREELRAGGADDDALLAGLARSYMQMGALERQASGKVEDARVRYQAAVDLLLPRMADGPARGELPRALSDALNLLGDQQSYGGDYAAAVASQRKALALVEKALATPGDDGINWRQRRAVTRMKLGDAMWWAEQDTPEAVMAMLRSGVEDFEAVLDAEPGNARLIRSTAIAQSGLSVVVAYEIDVVEALAPAQRSMELLERLLKLDPGNPQFRRDMARTQMQVSDLMETGGEWKLAADLADVALPAMASVRDGDPASEQLQADWREMSCRVASLYTQGTLAKVEDARFVRPEACRRARACAAEVSKLAEGARLPSLPGKRLPELLAFAAACPG